MQSSPCGQQIAAFTEEVAFNAKQCVPVGQQKSDGKERPHCCKALFPPHVAALSERVFPASGSNSSDVHNALENVVGSRKESAKPSAYMRRVEIIVKEWSDKACCQLCVA
jgi:hypothetical protein